jgi:hypothetical protein
MRERTGLLTQPVFFGAIMEDVVSKILKAGKQIQAEALMFRKKNSFKNVQTVTFVAVNKLLPLNPQNGR